MYTYVRLIRRGCCIRVTRGTGRKKDKTPHLYTYREKGQNYDGCEDIQYNIHVYYRKE